MDIKDSSRSILDLVGGDANISGLTHCSTRLRFTVGDDSKVDAEALKQVPGVLGVVKGPQTQVIVGNHVVDMHREIERMRGGRGGAAAASTGPRRPLTWKRAGGTLMDFVVSVFTPIIPAIAGAGIFKALLVLAAAVGWLDNTSGDYLLLSAIPDAVFGFLPLLVAYTTAKKLDVNRPLALGIVGVLVFPAFTALVSAEGGATLFGLAVPNVAYNAQVFPAILAVLLLWPIERFLNRVVWSPIRTFFVPLVCIIVVAPATIFLLGPLGYWLGTLLTGAMLGLYGTLGWVAVALTAAVLPLVISVGMHKAFIPPTIATVAAQGKDSFYLVASLAHNLSEAGSSFGVALRTKNATLRGTAVSGGISALFGITEPALYGVTLQNRRALISVIVGALAAGSYIGITLVDAFAVVSPGLASLPMFVDALDPWNLLHALIGAVIAVGVSFTVSAILWKDSDSGTLRALGVQKDAATPDSEQAAAPLAIGADQILSPLTGRVVALSEVSDPVFSGGILGEGVAIVPTDGTVRAPLAGVVTSLLDSKHAVGITSDTGVEVLVHVGLDTVKLEGAPFTARVAQGDRVEAGQVLVVADLAAIEAAGYDTTTPVVVVNSQAYGVTTDAVGTITSGEPLLRVAEKELSN
jgi:PTS system beta-glucosides-specific IIC component